MYYIYVLSEIAFEQIEHIEMTLSVINNVRNVSLGRTRKELSSRLGRSRKERRLAIISYADESVHLYIH